MNAQTEDARPGDAPPPYDAVVFDCDSTLSSIEGIDELAGERRAEIEELTRRAMAGEIPLEQVYRSRLELLRPSRSQLERVGALYVERVAPHAVELIAALRTLDKQVWIVSGGLRPAVLTLGRHLGLDAARVLAVETRHDAEGGWLGYEHDSPLARSGGKPPVLARIAAGTGPRGVVMIGDGITDLEATPHLRRFVAYGGVVARPEVLDRACVHTLERDMAALLALVCSPDEISDLERSGEHRQLLSAAARLE